jgi:hypothetical protein
LKDSLKWVIWCFSNSSPMSNLHWLLALIRNLLFASSTRFLCYNVWVLLHTS